LAYVSRAEIGEILSAGDSGANEGAGERTQRRFEMQAQQQVVSSAQDLAVGVYPAGEIQKLKSERVQLRAGEVPVELTSDGPVLRGRLSIGEVISLSFELDGGSFCLGGVGEPGSEGGGEPSAPIPEGPPIVPAVKEGDHARV